MASITIEYAAKIDASPEKVYAILADYHNGHPAILPKNYFKTVVVEKGGTGEDTLVRIGMKIFISVVCCLVPAAVTGASTLGLWWFYVKK